MIKSKRQMFIVIGVFALVMLLGTVTYAFFNYTRTGSSNIIKVGRISFVSKNEQTITLNNLFPIDPNETGIMNDNTKVGTYEIDIEGDTDYVDGLEYLITTSDVHIYTSEGKVIPISLDITVNNLGDESSTYFTSRNSKNANIYKRMSTSSIVGEQQLLVGYIKPNTVSGSKEGVNGTITIKAYLDKNKIAITDTPEENVEWQDERTIISTSEWNALQASGVSFKVKVEANEGIWINEPIYEIMRKSTVMDNVNSTYVNNSTPGIDFSEISSDTNGKGIYTMTETENDAYPIMYYRGDVQNNNVLFGGFCWKIIRTTDTGGIKMLYNGNPVNNQCGNDRIIEKNQVIEISLEFYSLDNYESVYYSDSYEYYATNKVFRLAGNIIQSVWSEANASNLIGKYTCFSTDANETCRSLSKIHSYSYNSDTHINTTQVVVDSSIVLDDNDFNKDNVQYNLEVESVASVGYMYGTDYIIQKPTGALGVNSIYIGTGFTYENGKYSLTNPTKLTVAQVSTHHYSCGLTDPNGTCTSIRYYISFYSMNSQPYVSYITLTNGKSIEDALDEMFTNTHDSLAKSMIDTWYSENMVNYTGKLEDTIYCNDRSIKSLGGFNPNGGLVNSTGYKLSFNIKGIKCSLKRDSFTVSLEKGNGMLDYPVGMLTNDEATLAGAIHGLDNPNTSFYLYDGNGFWTMTPNSFQTMSYVQRIYGGNYLYDGGNTGGTRVDHTGYMSGFRPVISLKEGTGATSGTGTPTNPYVVE